MVVLHVPHGVGVPHRGVAAHLALLEAPLGQSLGGAGEDALDEVVVELELGGHSVHHLPLLPADDLEPPDVVGVAGPVLPVAGHLEVSLADRGGLSVTVDIPLGGGVLQSH